jgi:hypothetical protein
MPLVGWKLSSFKTHLLCWWYSLALLLEQVCCSDFRKDERAANLPNEAVRQLCLLEKTYGESCFTENLYFPSPGGRG